MSSFCGVFLNLPGVSVDKFDGVNQNSDQFFLSHCHAGKLIFNFTKFLPKFFLWKVFMNLKTIAFQNQPSKNLVFLFYVRLSKVAFMKIHSIVISTQCGILAILPSLIFYVKSSYKNYHIDKLKSTEFWFSKFKFTKKLKWQKNS